MNIFRGKYWSYGLDSYAQESLDVLEVEILRTQSRNAILLRSHLYKYWNPNEFLDSIFMTIKLLIWDPQMHVFLYLRG